MASFPPFDLGDAAPEPLDLTGLGANQPQQAQPASLPPDQRKHWLRLAMMIPLALKGGPGAIEGLLGGLNQGDVYNQRQQRLDAEEQRRQQQITAQEQYRQQALQQTQENQHAIRQQAFMKEVADRAAAATNQGEADAVIQFYAPLAAKVGIRPGAVEGYVRQTANAAKLRKKQIEKQWSGLPAEMKTRALADQQWTMQLEDGTQVEASEWMPIVQPMVDPTTGKPPVSTPKVDVPNTPEEKMADAIRRGDKAEIAVLEEAAERLSGSRRKPDAPAAGAPNPRMDTRIDRIVTSFNSHPIVKEYNEVQSQQGIINRIVSGAWTGPSDMAIVFAFMKALDPNSVVRETEYANAAASGNIFAGWAARFNGALSPSGGFLSDRVRQDFLRTISSRMEVKQGQYDNLRSQLAARIDRIKAGAPETGDEALVDYSKGGDAPVDDGTWTALPDGKTKVRIKR